MHCEDVRELFGNYLDQELTDTLRRRVEEHAASCAACAADLRSLQEAVLRLHESPAPEAPNPWPFERLLNRLAREHDLPLGESALASDPLSQLSLNITTDEENS